MTRQTNQKYENYSGKHHQFVGWMQRPFHCCAMCHCRCMGRYTTIMSCWMPKQSPQWRGQSRLLFISVLVDIKVLVIRNLLVTKKWARIILDVKHRVRYFHANFFVTKWVMAFSSFLKGEVYFLIRVNLFTQVKYSTYKAQNKVRAVRLDARPPLRIISK